MHYTRSDWDATGHGMEHDTRSTIDAITILRGETWKALDHCHFFSFVSLSLSFPPPFYFFSLDKTSSREHGSQPMRDANIPLLSTSQPAGNWTSQQRLCGFFHFVLRLGFGLRKELLTIGMGRIASSRPSIGAPKWLAAYKQMHVALAN